MSGTPQTVSESAARGSDRGRSALPPMMRIAVVYARIAIGAAFLSAVADRFGLWGSQSSWGNFSNFTHYTAQVLSFMPAVSIPSFAWAATILETLFGITLILGLWTRWIAYGSAALLFIFGIAMWISLGVHKPLAFSVFSASAGALILALCLSPGRRAGKN
jgi:uncharacterized membrane protein YphA (DoxX/SURF4 family)